MSEPRPPEVEAQLRRGVAAVLWITWSVLVTALLPMVLLAADGDPDPNRGLLWFGALVWLAVLLCLLGKRNIVIPILLMLSLAAMAGYLFWVIADDKSGIARLILPPAIVHAAVAIGIAWELRHLFRMQRLLIEFPEAGETLGYRATLFWLRMGAAGTVVYEVLRGAL